MEGIIIRALSGEFTVTDFDNTIEYTCKARGKLAYVKDQLKVGSKVVIDEKELVITKVLPNKNTLVRPLMSNVDKMFVITSVASPDLNLYLLDKMIAIYEYYDITPILLFTKLDLWDKDMSELDSLFDYYRKMGYKVYTGCNKIFDKNIQDGITGNICAVSGQSGVGKSTFMNFLSPVFQRKTDEISEALGRGKHTTRDAFLFRFNGGWIADTPGFGNIELPKMELNIVPFLFKDFESRSECKYNNCTHTNEPHCAIIEEVNEGIILKSRYENYQRFLQEIKQLNSRY